MIHFRFRFVVILCYFLLGFVLVFVLPVTRANGEDWYFHELWRDYGLINSSYHTRWILVETFFLRLLLWPGVFMGRL